jgi:hypothetical protein
VPEILPEIHLTIPPTIILLPSMKTITKKRGRKPKSYIASWGDVFPGLRRRPSDGRWEANGKVFSEADERKAVQRYQEMIGNGESRLEWSEKFRIAQLTNWNWIADQIRSRPSWVAQKTGIEQIGYLTDIKPPKPLPSLDVLEQEWKNHARCSKDQKAKVLRAWQDFRETSEIGGLPKTAKAFTNSNGDHLFFKYPKGRQISIGQQLGGIIADERNAASKHVLEKLGLTWRKTYELNGASIDFYSRSIEEYQVKSAGSI